MKEAPTFYKVLKSIAMPPTISRNQRKKLLLKPIIGCAGAVLLKGHNSRLSAAQHLVGLSLFLGRTRKKLTVVEERGEESTAVDTPSEDPNVDCEDVPDGFDSRSVVSNDSLVSSVNSDSDNNDDSGEATPLQCVTMA